MTDELLTTKEHTEAHGDKIKGYRKLTDDEIEVINKIKAAGDNLDELLDNILLTHGVQTRDDSEGVDERWFSSARTDLQVGIMKLVRSVAKPAGF